MGAPLGCGRRLARAGRGARLFVLHRALQHLQGAVFASDCLLRAGSNQELRFCSHPKCLKYFDLRHSINAVLDAVFSRYLLSNHRLLKDLKTSQSFVTFGV